MKSEAEKIKELLEKVEAGTAITLYKTSNNMWFARLQDGTYSKNIYNYFRSIRKILF